MPARRRMPLLAACRRGAACPAANNTRGAGANGAPRPAPCGEPTTPAALQGGRYEAVAAPELSLFPEEADAPAFSPDSGDDFFGAASSLPAEPFPLAEAPSAPDPSAGLLFLRA